MNVFKVAYRVVRRNSDVIYQGFGFRHLSDVTQYYVHPDNESFRGTTTLCQPIGESVILFARFLRAMGEGKPIGDYFFSENRDTVFFILNVPEDYRDEGVVASNIFQYRALARGRDITIAAYDEDGRWIEGDMEHLHPLYKLLPVFLVLLAQSVETDADYRELMDRFVSEPAADLFVNVHEDFYQNHKVAEYDISYSDLAGVSTDVMRSCSESFHVLRDNKEKRREKPESKIVPFPDDAFSEAQKAYIPALPEEFILPASLTNVCNALAAGDLRAVLFHGPAGTGKTMACKLIAQAVRLPILETINCTENLDEFVLGKFLPEGEAVVFQESYVTKAIRDGGAVVFEEINFAKPQHLAFLNSLLDDNGFVRLDNGEFVRRHPNFRFFATMNLGYFGTRELNQALYNRFNAVIELAALSDDAISRMLTARVPSCAPFVGKMLSVYHKLQKKIQAEELDVVLSPRNLENWARLAKYDGYLRAAEKTILPVAKCDRALEHTIRSILMLYRWK